MMFFTADLHLGHKNIIKYCNRPFGSVDEMDRVLINNINDKVGLNDKLYIVGDFTFGDMATVTNYRRRIVCPNVALIRGNHDKLSSGQYVSAGFEYCGHMADMHVGKQDITLCHYAMRRWNKSHHGSWQLFGHSHGCLEDDPKLLSFDVGVDCHEYKPLSFEDVARIMGKRAQAVASPNH